MGNDVGGPVRMGPSKDFDSSLRGVVTGNTPVKAATDGTDATPVVTEIYIAELTVNRRGKATGFALFNGSAVDGNVKAMLYNAAGTRIAISASTAQAGTDAFQRIPFSAPVMLQPGTYYIGVIFNDTDARFNAHPVGNFGASKRTGTTFASPSATITPPTTFTADLGPMGGLY